MADLPLTSGELTAMRATVDSYLAGTAVLLEPTLASDGQGGQTATFAAAGTVTARLAPETQRGQEAMLAGRVAEVSYWILTLPAHTVINETWRVTYDTVTYEVEEVMTRVPEELGRRVRLREID